MDPSIRELDLPQMPREATRESDRRRELVFYAQRGASDGWAGWQA